MTHPYATLLSPIHRRGMVIRNRMTMSRAYPPFSTGVESRELQKIMIPYVGNLAKNGAAIVVLPSPRSSFLPRYVPQLCKRKPL